MDNPGRHRFHYNANAHALSAQFDRPFKQLIEVQAPAALPTIGGYGSSRVNDFRFNELVSFKSAYSYVSGSEQREEGKVYHTTLVTTTVEGLNIMDVVTADRVVARLAASYEFGHDESKIIPLGSKFENLQIAGCPVKAEFDHELFLKTETFADLRKEFESNEEFRRIAEDQFRSGTKQQPKPCGVLLCSLVKRIETTCPGVKIQGHGLVVPKFGTVFLGELLAEHGKRTLTMIRLELGSPVSGSGVVAQVAGNGHHWP
jgi:hypothetical protein